MLPTFFTCNYSNVSEKGQRFSRVGTTIFLLKFLLQKVPYLVPLYVAYFLVNSLFVFKILIAKFKTKFDLSIFAIIRHMFKKLLFFFVRPVFKILRTFTYRIYVNNNRPGLINTEVWLLTWIYNSNRSQIVTEPTWHNLK